MVFLAYFLTFCTYNKISDLFLNIILKQNIVKNFHLELKQKSNPLFQPDQLKHAH